MSNRGRVRFSHHVNANDVWYNALNDTPGRAGPPIGVPPDSPRQAHATKSVPLAGAFWDAGAGVFINKGRNGVWRDGLTADDSRRYEERAEAELGPECARWLVTGELPG